MRAVSLCTGYAGITLGLQMVIPNYRPILYCEIDNYAQSILRHRMADSLLPTAPIHPDLHTLDTLPKCNILTAGYPCQPFSQAASRKTAYDLWPEILRIIRLTRPPLIFLENVQRYPIERSCNDLQSLNYQSRFYRVSAEELGAPHRRNRWFSLSYSHDQSESNSPVYAEVSRLPRMDPPNRAWPNPPASIRMDNGYTDWVDRMRLCGNGVVPLMAAVAFTTLAYGAVASHKL